MKPKVIISLNTAWNLLNFRAGLIRALVAAGYEVVGVASQDEYSAKLTSLGCRFVPLAVDGGGTNFGRDLLLLGRFFCILRSERPDVYLGYTVKPNIYGSLAAQTLGIPVINNIAGLGSVFIKKSWLTHLVRFLYRLSLSRSAKVFFQNIDDRQLFVLSGLVNKAVTDILPGSGVDLIKFEPLPLPRETRFRFLLVGRMLWDKGVGEFVEAARMLRQRGVEADFFLLGFLDVQNPAAISRQMMDGWVAEGVVQYLGVSEDVRDQIAASDCVVLPSYREGTPRALLEAAAIGRPIITTNAVGCREVVDDGVNGFLCRPRDSGDLAHKMERMFATSNAERERMGLLGRRKVEREFDENIVIRKYLQVIQQILNSRKN